MIYVYLLLRPGDPPPPPGHTGFGPVHAWPLAEVVAWGSEVSAPPPPQLDALRTHDAVVRTALRAATPLPVRFGTVVADLAALEAALAPRAQDLAAALAFLEGCVEIGLTLPWHRPAPTPPRPTSGRAYLEGRAAALRAAAARRAEATAALEAVAAALRPWARATKVEVHATPTLAGRVAYLVHRRQLGAVRAALPAVRKTWPSLGISGPWAPYSFADANIDAP